MHPLIQTHLKMDDNNNNRSSDSDESLSSSSSSSTTTRKEISTDHMLYDFNTIGTTKTITNRPKRILYDGYQLNEYDVYCGRGFLCFNHIGNHHFRTLVHNNIHRYQNSITKFQKSLIIQEIVDHVRLKSIDGGFVKKDTVSGRYYDVGDSHAREKTSQAFRDASCGKYKSSRVGTVVKHQNNDGKRNNDQLLHYVVDSTTTTTLPLNNPVPKQAQAQELTAQTIMPLLHESRTTTVPSLLQTYEVTMHNNDILAKMLVSENNSNDGYYQPTTSKDNTNYILPPIPKRYKLSKLDLKSLSSSTSALPKTKTIQRYTSIGWVETPVLSSSLSSGTTGMVDDNDDEFETFTIDETIFDDYPQQQQSQQQSQLCMVDDYQHQQQQQQNVSYLEKANDTDDCYCNNLSTIHTDDWDAFFQSLY